MRREECGETGSGSENFAGSHLGSIAQNIDGMPPVDDQSEFAMRQPFGADRLAEINDIDVAGPQREPSIVKFEVGAAVDDQADINFLAAIPGAALPGAIDIERVGIVIPEFTIAGERTAQPRLERLVRWGGSLDLHALQHRCTPIVQGVLR